MYVMLSNIVDNVFSNVSMYHLDTQIQAEIEESLMFIFLLILTVKYIALLRSNLAEICVWPQSKMPSVASLGSGSLRH